MGAGRGQHRRRHASHWPELNERKEESVEKTVKFKVEKETKNTVKFEEVPAEGQPPIIGTLYVQKWFAGNATEIEVTVRKP